MYNAGAGWQPISTAPKDGSFILLHVPHGLDTGSVTVGCYWKEDERDERGRFKPGHWDRFTLQGFLGMDADTAPSWCEPTHWMWLPSSPALSSLHGDGT